MESAAGEGMELGLAVALLAAGVVAVPIFRRLGLGSVLGYLAAGLVVGPFGFGLFKDPQAILQVAELGVVMFLFLIGLEMRPAKLWALRAEIFGLGLVQVELDHTEQALDAFERALDVYPLMQGARMNADTLRKQLQDKSI